MKTKLLPILLCALLVFTVAAGAKGLKASRIVGAVTAVDDAAQQLTVAGITVQVTPATILTMKDLVIAFEDIEVGMTVIACGVLEDGVLTAHKVNVKYLGQ